MGSYKPLLIQKLTSGASIVNTVDYNIYVKSIPFRPVPDLKEPYIKDLPDQNGNQVCYPDTPVYKAYDLECAFVYIGDSLTAAPMIKLFVRYLVEGGMFKMYDEYENIGRTNINYKSYTPDKFYGGDSDTVEFKITFTVNDPMTDIVITKTT